MGFIIAAIGAVVLSQAFDKSGAAFTSAKNEWTLGIGCGLIVLGAILYLVRGDND